MAVVIANTKSLMAGSTTGLTRGSVCWMAPELLRYNPPPSKPSKKTDIYAFGCTIFEVLEPTHSPQSKLLNFAQILTRQPPLSELKYDVAVSMKVLAGERPTWPSNQIELRIWRIIEKCWDQEAQNRPSIEKLHKVSFSWHDSETRQYIQVDRDEDLEDN